ncbi:hypothetical protein K488DRAFT_48857 [Vararia minispora EC-137]|uniref:Uncharacterized protein n=1 Tax=Vararia minispora EC-137 TaxID=1314806 RepID=A0ACB8QM43_9AGAM|nr:hypothetical protein K488DRAFT_48857 [Vararia minispora EC-137]
MADSASSPASDPQPQTRSAVPALQRGRACLRCRKRKMRCDGGKPACQQCQKAKKGSQCEYDDGKGKTRTQILRENVARLEARVRELEGNATERAASSVTLFDPHSLSYSGDSSSPSSTGSPTSIPFTASASPYPFCARHSIPCCSSFSERVSCPSVITNTVHLDTAFTMAVVVFLPHAHQVGLVLQADRLRGSLLMSAEDQRHPVLMNAIYLWACYLSRPQALSQHESLYLSRATDAFNDAHRGLTKVVDVVQGCCLVALYLLTNGRLSEGSFYLSSAASLAVQWGLHRRVSEVIDSAISLDPSFVLPPPMDSVEQGERNLAFWQVYYLDSCWSPVLQRPRTIEDGRNMMSSITAPWPLEMEEYEAGTFPSVTDVPTVQTFLAHQGQVSSYPSGFSVSALRVKAAALVDAATRISSGWDARSPNLTDALIEQTNVVEVTINRFLSNLLPVQQLNAVLAADKHALLVVHSLAHYATIQLHFYLAGGADPVRHDKCLQAARAILFVIRHITDADYDYLDPIVGSCWAAAGCVFVREVTRVEAWSAVTSDCRPHVATLLSAMSKLSARFPLVGMYPCF